ncbi:MAG: MlaD family protein [Solirubrobacteraceae bacterium]
MSRVAATFRERPALAGLVTTVVGIFLLAVAVTRGQLLLPGPGEHDITAQFAATNELRTGDSVRLHGIKVGTVKAIALDLPARRTDVQLALTDSHIQLYSNARADLRWTTILGGVLYVDLSPGSTNAGALGNAPIQLARTSSQVEFDQLTGTLGGGGLNDVRTTLRQLDTGFSDPAAVGQTLHALPPTMHSLDGGLTPLLGTQADDLRTLIATTNQTLSGLDRNSGALSALVANAARVTSTTAADRAAVGQTFQDLGPTLSNLRLTSQQLDYTLTLLDPLATQLEPGARAIAPTTVSLKPTLANVTDILHQARPLLSALDPALSSLQDAARAGVPLLHAMNPTLQRLHGELLPFLQRVDPDTQHRTIDMIGPTVAGVANASSEFDAAGNILHFGVLGDERTLVDLPCQSFLTDPTAPQKLRCDALTKVLGTLFGGPRQGSTTG